MHLLKRHRFREKPTAICKYFDKHFVNTDTCFGLLVEEDDDQPAPPPKEAKLNFHMLSSYFHEHHAVVDMSQFPLFASVVSQSIGYTAVLNKTLLRLRLSNFFSR